MSVVQLWRNSLNAVVGKVDERLERVVLDGALRAGAKEIKLDAPGLTAERISAIEVMHREALDKDVAGRESYTAVGRAKFLKANTRFHNAVHESSKGD